MSARLSGLPAYVSLSKFTISTSRWDLSRCRIKFDPIKPAPPVTRIFTPSLLFVLPVGHVHNRCPVLFAVSPMSRRSPTTWDFVCSGLGHHVGGTKQRFKGTGIRPPAFQVPVGEGTLPKLHIVHVGDLQFITPAGLGFSYFVEHALIVKVDAGNGIL